MTPEQKARCTIDKKLMDAGWIIQDLKSLNLSAGLGVAVREFPTSTGPVDYALFVDGVPVGVVEAKKDESGQKLTSAEGQSNRYANSRFKWVSGEYKVRFAYEATGKLTRFTDYKDIKCASRLVFSFFQPQELQRLLQQKDTIRNRMKRFPPLDTSGLRGCQIAAIQNLEKSFAGNHQRALIQMATGSGKTFTAITAAYRLLKYAGVHRILFLVDTRGLGIQANKAFLSYHPKDDTRSFAEIYGVRHLTSSYIPSDACVCISTIQRMYSMLKGEELDESVEQESLNENPSIDFQPPKEVVYNAKYPPEFFDVIIIDECHRSIYNVWNQVLEYFDAFEIGLTATPDTRTIGYFKENVVSEYSREQAIVDGVNVGEDVFFIETEIGTHGATILKQVVERRDRMSREKRWAQLDEDINYQPPQLDRDIVNPSQIRAVIRSFRDNLYTTLFPRRKEVPKTLIFAKSDSHADDIVQTVREEFGEGNEFCQKVTYTIPDPQQTIRDFTNSYYPRIAVTVDMIATGTDIQAVECLIFMRDVRSKNYFEQMKGRGTRVISKDALQQVTPSATENKDHFVIIDAVGVTRSKKTETRALERKPGISLKNLMMNIALGSRDADTLTSLANRIIRLNAQMSPAEQKEFAETVGRTASQTAEQLLNAFDEDCITSSAQSAFHCVTPTPEQFAQAQKNAIADAVKPFHNPNVRDFIENVRRSHEQIIDNVNLDHVIFSGFDTQRESNATQVIQNFRTFIEENKDEIMALRILYSQTYHDRPMVIDGLKALYEKLKSQGITIDRLWDCYAITKPEKVRSRSTIHQLADLVAIIRFEMNVSDSLQPFAEAVNYNFKQWIFRRNAGAVHFTEEQMAWLRLIKDHIAVSLSIEPEDLELSPFDGKGGLGRFYEVFGAEYRKVLDEMNVELVA